MGLSLRDGFTYLDPHVAFKVVAMVLLLVFLHRMLSEPKQYRLFPVWATIEIALTGCIIQHDWLSCNYSAIRRHRGSLFGLTTMHQVLVNYADVDRLMSQSYQVINAQPVQYTILTRIFGAVDTPDLKRKLENSWKDLLTPIERMFLNDAASIAAIEKGNIPQEASSFVSFSENAEHMKRWEQSADIHLITSESEYGGGTVEANLLSLTRDFGACFAIPLLYGQDFLDRYTQLLDDFWKLDNDVFPLLMIGIPSWAPFKIMKEGVAARSRLVKEIEDLYRRIDQHQRGEPIDHDADLSDVSRAALERNKIYNREDGHSDIVEKETWRSYGVKMQTHNRFFSGTWLMSILPRVS